MDGAVPLTPIQAWFFEQEQPAPWHYNQAVLLDVDPVGGRRRAGDGARRPCWSTTTPCACASAGRTRGGSSGTPTRRGSPWSGSTWPGWTGTRRTARRRRSRRERQASLDLEQGPLGRAVLFDRGERGRVLLLVLHHLVVDGVSWRILRDDLELACAAGAGSRWTRVAKSTSFRQWAGALQAYAAGRTRWPRRWRTGGRRGRTAPHPCRWTREAADGGGTVAVRLDAEETRALLQDVPAAYRTQINDVLLCALADALAAWTGSPRVRIALEGHGREEEIGAGDGPDAHGGLVHHRVPAGAGPGGGGRPRGAAQAGQGAAAGRPRAGHRLRPAALPVAGRGAPPARWRPRRSRRSRSTTWASSSRSARRRAAALHGAGGPVPTSAPGNRRRYLLDVNGGVRARCLEMGWSYGGAQRRETIERLAAAYVDALRALIAHCTSAGAGGCTPSDFPLAALTQGELDAVRRTGARRWRTCIRCRPCRRGSSFTRSPARGRRRTRCSWRSAWRGRWTRSCFAARGRRSCAGTPSCARSFAWRGAAPAAAARPRRSGPAVAGGGLDGAGRRGAGGGRWSGTWPRTARAASGWTRRR